LTAGYGELAAVRDLNLNVRAGEIVALFGPNGAGKTTTLGACVGMLPTLAGQVRWLGRVETLVTHKLARKGIAYVPEGRSVTTKLSVRDNLRLGRGGIAPAVAVFPELEALLDRQAGLLGRELESSPRVLLVDELSLGLAPLVVLRLLSALRRAADETGLAVLLVEQQARNALTVADRWYLLRDGAIAQQGDGNTSLGVLEAAYLASMSDTPAVSATSATAPPNGAVINSS
jgi:branched-chain amino acid transport system ATP-binding protein